MQLITEAGFTGIVVVAVFVTGLFLRLSGRASSTTPWALALLAVGQLGQSLGQRAVADAVVRMKGDLADRAVELLAQGSAEASANLLLAGGCALVLLAIGAARDRAAAPL